MDRPATLRGDRQRSYETRAVTDALSNGPPVGGVGVRLMLSTDPTYTVQVPVFFQPSDPQLIKLA